jgi:hypothetical protein
MRSFDFGRYTLCICVALAMLAGCGVLPLSVSKGQDDMQPLMGVPGAMAQTYRLAAHADRGTSWMLPEAKSEDLIYATGGCAGTCVLSYPAGKLVGSLETGGDLDGSSAGCVDGNGDVFLPDNESEVEYAHGGSKPIATLTLPGSSAGACSIDPTTGNLAVIANFSGVGIAVFANAKGTPTIYGAGILPYGCGYDNQGNLFVSGLNSGLPGLSELPRGASNFTILTISGKVGSPGQLQWDGHHVSYEGVDKGHITASRLRIAGSTATVIHVTHFKGINGNAYLSWIYNGKILIPFSPRRSPKASLIGVWDYPGGGKAVRVYQPSGTSQDVNFQAVTLSTAR